MYTIIFDSSVLNLYDELYANKTNRKCKTYLSNIKQQINLYDDWKKCRYLNAK